MTIIIIIIIIIMAGRYHVSVMYAARTMDGHSGRNLVNFGYICIACSAVQAKRRSLLRSVL